MNSFTIKAAAAAFAVAALTAPAAAQDALANGSFEESSPSGPFQTVNTLPGWQVDGDVDLIGDYWQPQQGRNSIDLNGNVPGAISQTITGLTAGLTYVVSFWISGNPDSNPLNINPKTATLTLGTATNNVSYTLTAANTRADMNWSKVSFAFVAAEATAQLALRSTTAGSWGMAVDNFQISAAPEPGTWAMMILGFGVAGTALRTRRRRLVAA